MAVSCKQLLFGVMPKLSGLFWNLNTGANVNAKGGVCGNALQAASYQGMVHQIGQKSMNLMKSPISGWFQPSGSSLDSLDQAGQAEPSLIPACSAQFMESKLLLALMECMNQAGQHEVAPNHLLSSTLVSLASGIVHGMSRLHPCYLYVTTIH